MSKSHLPVLLGEILEGFSPCRLATFVDGTLGAGGHAKALLQAHPELTRYIGFDRDASALALARQTLQDEARVIYVQEEFGEMAVQLKALGIPQVDGILMDLGVSSMQLDQPERGFSFSKGGPLDMRMDPRQPLTAEEIVNSWSERELTSLFREGEVVAPHRVAAVIIEERAKRPIRTTDQLVQLVSRGRSHKIHPATLVFQALRMVVNDELGLLERTLPVAISLLRSGGRLAVITFHSLEDRIVKNTFRDAAAERRAAPEKPLGYIPQVPQVRLVHKKALSASPDEVHANPRSRSAKLRMVEKL